MGLILLIVGVFSAFIGFSMLVFEYHSMRQKAIGAIVCLTGIAITVSGPVLYKQPLTTETRNQAEAREAAEIEAFETADYRCIASETDGYGFCSVNDEELVVTVTAGSLPDEWTACDYDRRADRMVCDGHVAEIPSDAVAP